MTLKLSFSVAWANFSNTIQRVFAYDVTASQKHRWIVLLADFFRDGANEDIVELEFAAKRDFDRELIARFYPFTSLNELFHFRKFRKR